MATPYREIPIYQAQEDFKLDKELTKSLRELKVGRKLIERMKRDAVNCPLYGDRTPAARCLSCQYFVRRVKGVIHCGYGL